MTTARCGPAGNTIASPWPTAHTTITQWSGGQPEASIRTGSAPSIPARAATSTSRRTITRRAATSRATVIAASSNAPHTPSGQGRAPAGTRAP
jgi:hypothetical protein